MLSKSALAIALSVAAVVKGPEAVGVGAQALGSVVLAVVAGLVFIVVVLLVSKRDASFRSRSPRGTTTYTLSFPTRAPARRARKRRRRS
jgi:hypothetical protein